MNNKTTIAIISGTYIERIKLFEIFKIMLDNKVKAFRQSRDMIRIETNTYTFLFLESNTVHNHTYDFFIDFTESEVSKSVIKDSETKLLEKYGQFVGEIAIEAENEEDDCVYQLLSPEEYIEHLYESDELPNEEAVKEFLSHFYDDEQTKRIIDTYFINKDNVLDWIHSQLKEVGMDDIKVAIV